MITKNNSLFSTIVLMLLIFLHFHLFTPLLDKGVNILLFFNNLFFLIFLNLYRKKYTRIGITLFIVGYAFIFFSLYVFSGQPLIFILLALLYLPLYRMPRALGHFLILVFTISYMTPYWLQLAIAGSLIFEIFYITMYKKPSLFISSSFVMGLGLIIFIIMPILYLVSMSTPQTLINVLGEKKVQNAILQSFGTASATTFIALLFGVPLAYALTRSSFKGKSFILALIDMPILIPQTVVGLSILVLAGPKAPLGYFLYQKFNINISDSSLGIIMAQLFVSAPFAIRASMTAFSGVDVKLESISRTLGASQASTFFRISLPLAIKGIVAGAILTWSRAISEAGSLMVIAYHPLTVSTLVHEKFTSWGLEEARPVAIIFVIICLWIFVLGNVLLKYPVNFFNYNKNLSDS